MGKILKFPDQRRCTSVEEVPAKPAKQASHWTIRVVWAIAVLSWPLARKILGIDCFIQLFIAIYRWDDAPFRAGFTFSLHFLTLCLLTYFVMFYQPKDH